MIDEPAGPRPAAVVCSYQRGEVLGDVVADLLAQDHPVDVVLSVVSDADLAGVPEALLRDPRVRVLTGEAGLPRQRNRALDALIDHDVVFFFDDDAVPDAGYVRQALAVLESRPDAVGLTGAVVADGSVTGAEIGREESVRLLAGAELSSAVESSPDLFGCNFAVRTAAVRGLRFDERLPLYAWLEDRDFSARLARAGGLVRAAGCRVVHRGVQSGGRQNHKRLGYSQVVNAVYLWRAGSLGAGETARLVGRPGAANLAGSATGPDAAWRRQRLRGNLAGAGDVVRGLVDPERALQH